MRSKEEIQTKLDELNLEYQDIKNWHDTAYEKYQKERNFWGKDADRGEMDYASDVMSDCSIKIKMLKWVLTLEDEV